MGHEMTMRVYGLVPARSGSKGLPDKNILKVNGHPLMAYAIAYGKKLNLDRLFVSTDSRDYAQIATRYGAECPYLRGHRASGDTAMEEDILQDCTDNFPAHGIPMPQIWIWLKPTSPFKCLTAGVEALEVLESRPQVDSVRIVSETESRIHHINDSGYLEPTSPLWDPGRSKIRRTELPCAFQPFNLEVFRHENWAGFGSRFMGDRIHPIIRPRITGLDIDDLDSFEIVKALIEADPRPSVVAKYVHL